MTTGKQPPREPSRPRSSTRKAGAGALDRIPNWVQAMVAVVTLVFTIGVAYGIFGRPASGPPATATVQPSVEGTPLPPIVHAERWEEEADGDLIIYGTFENLNLGQLTIYLIGQPRSAPTDENWVPVRAEALATFTFPVNLANGEWQATRPQQYIGYVWRPIAWPSGSGAGDAFQELRLHGPEAEDVQAVGDSIDPDA
jgi:hypothetical protein